MAFGVVVDVVQPRQAGDLALDGVVGPGDAGEQVGHAEDDGDADAGQQSEDDDAGEGGGDHDSASLRRNAAMRRISGTSMRRTPA